jgi:uncharacterized membrane protein YedE/YeeE
MRNLVTVFTGLIFGIGLIMSGMTNPAKVQNFLDLFGTWDPSLALVMGGAILITMPGFWLVQKRQTPFFEDSFLIPQKTNLDFYLLTGSAIFGIGWGLGGFCPGPVIVSISNGSTGTILFVITMLIGMVLAKLLILRLQKINI